MSHSNVSPKAKSSSKPPAHSPKAMPPSPQCAGSSQFADSNPPSPPGSPDRPEKTPNSVEQSSSETRSPEELSPETLSLEATDRAVGCPLFGKHCPQLPAATRPDLEAFAFEHSCFRDNCFCDNALLRPENPIIHKKALSTVVAVDRAEVHFGPNKTHSAV